MRAMILTLALVAASTAAMADETADQKAAREAHNYDVIMQHYPPRALAAKEQGTVEFKVDIDRNGQATACTVTGSSGYPQLDKETCDLVLLNAKFARPTNATGGFASQSTVGVITWKHPGMAAAPSGKVKTVDARTAKKEKKICRAEIETGTLSRVHRTCMTVKDFDKATVEQKQAWEEMMGKGWKAGQ